MLTSSNIAQAVIWRVPVKDVILDKMYTFALNLKAGRNADSGEIAPALFVIGHVLSIDAQDGNVVIRIEVNQLEKFRHDLKVVFK